MSKYRQYAPWVLIAVAVIIFGWYGLGKKQPASAPATKSSEVSNQQVQAPAGEKISSSSQTMEGILEKSDNSNMGNLMLKTSGRVIYIFTNRDYSSLLGKETVVSYEGTLDSFRLGDIVAK